MVFDLMPSWLFWTTIVLWGALWGSFLNVVIARVPYGRSVVYPPSACMQCETPIRWYDNLPIVSWLVRRGRCRQCAASVPVRYLLVEVAGVGCSLLAAVLASGGLSLWRLDGVDPLEWLLVWMMLSYLLFGLVALTAIDIEHALLPHAITGFLVALAFVYAAIAPTGGDWRGFLPGASVFDALLGFSVGYGSLFGFALLFKLVTGRDGIGGGDFLLFGALGAWFGWEALPLLMMLAAIQGVIGYSLALLFFPAWIRDASAAGFWDADRASDALTLDADDEAKDARAPDASAADVRTPDAARATGSADDAESAEAPQRGIPFGPFLCLAAVEFLLGGPLYFAWLYGI